MDHEKHEINLSKSKESLRGQKEKTGKKALEVVADLDSQNPETEIEKNERLLKYWARVYRETESDFAKKEISRYDIKEYEKWENDARYDFDRIEEYEEELGCSEDAYRKDNLEMLSGMTKGEDTIEAFAGHFYDERIRALRNAIDSSDNKDKQEDKAKIFNFPKLVATFIEEVKDKSGTNLDANGVNHVRKNAHNEVIQALNDLNQIAEKYGVRRLTFRDFEYNTSGNYSEHKDKYEDASGRIMFGNTNARWIYDRRAVETYVRIAFSRDFRDVDEGHGDIFYDPNESLVRQFHG